MVISGDLETLNVKIFPPPPNFQNVPTSLIEFTRCISSEYVLFYIYYIVAWSRFSHVLWLGGNIDLPTDIRSSVFRLNFRHARQ
jgi:hypothetical protein